MFSLSLLFQYQFTAVFFETKSKPFFSLTPHHSW